LALAEHGLGRGDCGFVGSHLPAGFHLHSPFRVLLANCQTRSTASPSRDG
jgi:hypothetical protein